MSPLPRLPTPIEALRRRGILVTSPVEGRATPTPSAEPLFRIMARLAQFERSLIRGQVNAEPEAARERGWAEGRTRAVSHERMEAAAYALVQGRSKVEVSQAFGGDCATLHREVA